MSYRFTNTEKWQDAWFSNLTQLQMLLFIYLCDNCDIAGFIEVNYRRWAFDLSSSPDTIKGACKGLDKGLIFSNDNDCLFIRNFIKHQKNLPLNENNKAHQGIIKRFDNYRNKFNINDINDFINSPIEGAIKGLDSPTGNGNGNGIDNILESANKFYQREIEQNFEEPNIKDYKLTVNYLLNNPDLKKPVYHILKVQEQLTYAQFEKLINLYTFVKVKEKIKVWVNNAEYSKGKKTIHLTIENWCKR